MWSPRKKKKQKSHKIESNFQDFSCCKSYLSCFSDKKKDCTIEIKNVKKCLDGDTSQTQSDDDIIKYCNKTTSLHNQSIQQRAICSHQDLATQKSKTLHNTGLIV